MISKKVCKKGSITLSKRLLSSIGINPGDTVVIDTFNDRINCGVRITKREEKCIIIDEYGRRFEVEPKTIVIY